MLSSLRRPFAALPLGALVALVALVALPGCLSSERVIADAQPDTEPDAEHDAETAPQFVAVRIDDEWDGVCSGVPGQNGAKIDAVGLHKGDATHYLDVVVGEVGEGDDTIPMDPCRNDYTDLDQAKGPPDASKATPPSNTEIVVLQGGFIAGTFASDPVIAPGDAIVVYEVGADFGTKGEPFTLWLMTDPSCDPHADETCAILAGSGEGKTTFNLEDLAF